MGGDKVHGKKPKKKKKKKGGGRKTEVNKIIKKSRRKKRVGKERGNGKGKVHLLIQKKKKKAREKCISTLYENRFFYDILFTLFFAIFIFLSTLFARQFFSILLSV